MKSLVPWNRFRPARLLWHYLEVRRAERERRPPHGLPLLSLELTTACNARCRGCGYPAHYPLMRPPLETEEWLSIIDEACDLGVLAISLGGGEPLLFPDLDILIERIERRGVTTLLHTNGSLLTRERARRWARHRRLAIVFSLDSVTPEHHDEWRNLRCFDKVAAAIAELKRQAPQLPLSLLMTVHRGNFREMPELIELAARWAIPMARFTPLHRNLQHRFRPGEAWDPLEPDERELEGFPAIIESTLLRARRRGVITNSAVFLRAFPDFFRKRVPHRCLAGRLFASIDPAGQLFPCYDIQGGLEIEAVGGLARAWRSVTMESLRDAARHCERRCWNIGCAEPSLRFSLGVGPLWKQLCRESLLFLK